MRRSPLAVIMLLLLQTSESWSENNFSDCARGADRSYKTQNEQLMNQYYLGHVGGFEFERKRNEALAIYNEEIEVCQHKEVYAPIAEEQRPTASRAPASVYKPIGEEDEEIEGFSDCELEASQ